MSEESHEQFENEYGAPVVMPPSEARARRGIIISLSAVGVVLVLTVVMLVVLAVDARRTDSQSIISIVRDAAIVMVAFETLVIGLLLIVLMLQMRALIVLLRDEIQPMMESLNDTVSTVRGTTRFVSEKVVSPTIKAAGMWAGLRTVVREIADLFGLGR